MWLLKKSGKPGNELLPLISDKMAGKIARTGLRLQSCVSDAVNKRMKNVSGRRLKIILVLFCLGAGGYSMYLIGDAVKSPNLQTLKIDSVQIPRHVHDNSQDVPAANEYVDEQTYKQIRAFRQYVDSVKVREPAVFDSIINARPGLMDSVFMLEELYRQQK